MESLRSDYLFRKVLTLSSLNNNGPGLEITTVSRCARNCTYCPQSLLKSQYSEKHDGAPVGILTVDILEKALSNVDVEIILYWTGFSEPLQNSQWPQLYECSTKFVKRQNISTTLFTANNNSIDILEDTSRFSSITLHLPDNEGLMRANVTDQYLDNLTRVSRNLRPGIDSILVFGNAIHDDVKARLNKHEVLERHKDSIIVSGLDDGLLNSRAGNLSDRPLRDHTYPVYCSRGSFVQPVMLPDGDLQLCCMDYGLEEPVGSLLHNKYSRLVDLSATLMAARISRGVKSLCSNCDWAEHA